MQGNYAVPPTPQTTVTVPYSSGQTAGDLNVVVVGWNDSTAQVTSVTDSMANAYQLVVGPMVTGSRSQSIYYAKNISAAGAGGNAVTVAFSTPASYPDIRILEYKGIDPVSPVDTFGGATGNSATSSTGNLATTNPTDLLVAANTVQSSTYRPDNGFTQRMLTTPNGDIVEDRTVTTIGSYSASPTLTFAGQWVIQMVAFRATGGSSGQTPPPTNTVTLAWDANAATSSSDTNTVGYKLYTGPSSGNYTQQLDVGNATTTTLSNFASGSTYFCVVTAYDAAGVESQPSNEVSFVAP
jgi:hypothetical protein